jgi:hypothetical protein
MTHPAKVAWGLGLRATFAPARNPAHLRPTFAPGHITISIVGVTLREARGREPGRGAGVWGGPRGAGVMDNEEARQNFVFKFQPSQNFFVAVCRTLAPMISFQ